MPQIKDGDAGLSQGTSPFFRYETERYLQRSLQCAAKEHQVPRRFLIHKTTDDFRWE